MNTGACERIVVLNKRDLVPEWGMEVELLLLILRPRAYALLLLNSLFATPWLRNSLINKCSLLRGSVRGTSEI